RATRSRSSTERRSRRSSAAPRTRSGASSSSSPSRLRTSRRRSSRPAASSTSCVAPERFLYNSRHGSCSETPDVTDSTLVSGKGGRVVLEPDHSGVAAEDTRGRLLVRVAGIAAVILCVAMAAWVRGDQPLTAADIVRFLKASISERTILIELQSRGFGEPIDATRESQLREAGATETLIVALRRVAPLEKAASPAPLAPRTSASAGNTVAGPIFAAG